MPALRERLAGRVNVRQDQVVRGRTDALARAVLDWHRDDCERCRIETWLTCAKGARLFLAWWCYGRVALWQGGRAW